MTTAPADTPPPQGSRDVLGYHCPRGPAGQSVTRTQKCLHNVLSCSRRQGEALIPGPQTPGKASPHLAAPGGCCLNSQSYQDRGWQQTQSIWCPLGDRSSYCYLDDATPHHVPLSGAQVSVQASGSTPEWSGQYTSQAGSAPPLLGKCSHAAARRV